MKILFINHNSQRCGVADYGRRVFSILESQMDITMSDVEEDGYDVILYNYHYATCRPMKMEVARQIALFHEAHLNFQFDKVIAVQDLPRPLINWNPHGDHISSTSIIGSFGFGFADKGYERICELVKEQFPQGASIRFNIPFAEFGDNDGVLAKEQVKRCEEILNGSNISLNVNHDFLSQNDILRFLHRTDINLFLYKPSHGRGISSTIDYALSVKRPIGVSNSEMFRHLPKEICVDNISIPDLIKQGIEPLKKVYEDNSNEKFVSKIKEWLAR